MSEPVELSKALARTVSKVQKDFYMIGYILKTLVVSIRQKVITILCLSLVCQASADDYDPFECGPYWMHAPNMYSGKDSLLTWFKRCIEYENFDVNDQNYAGAEPRGFSGDSALHTAATWDDVEAIKYLVGKGAKLEITSEDGTTPLHRAVVQNSTRAVRVLLDLGANADATTPGRFENDWDYQTSALHLAVWTHNFIVSRILLAHGANVNLQVGFYGTPLHNLLEEVGGARRGMEREKYKYADICKLLVKYGADVSAKNHWGHSPIDLAENVLVYFEKNFAAPYDYPGMSRCVETVLASKVKQTE